MLLLPLGDDVPRRRVPFVNMALVLANVATFLVVATRPDYGRIVEVHGFTPASWTLGSLFASMFLHAGLVHLLGNMLFLSVLGDNVEDRYGHGGYAFFYLLSGVAAAFAHLLFGPAWGATVPAIGASGAVSGVLGAYLILFPFQRIRVLLLIIPLRVPAFLFLGSWVLVQWAAARAERDGAPTGVALWAHLGGFVFGAGVTALLRVFSRRA